MRFPCNPFLDTRFIKTIKKNISTKCILKRKIYLIVNLIVLIDLTKEVTTFTFCIICTNTLQIHSCCTIILLVDKYVTCIQNTNQVYKNRDYSIGCVIYVCIVLLEIATTAQINLRCVCSILHSKVRMLVSKI